MNKKMMNTKAMEVQFNWIFVLIVGAIILFFFITLAGRQKEVSGKQESLAVLDALETSISGQKASTDREDVLHQRSAFDLELLCEDKVKLSSRQSGFSRSLQNVVAFGPSVMAANDLLTMTKAWAIPFRVTNFLYMTTPETKYYIIHPDSAEYAEDFIKELHSNITVEPKTTASDIQFKGEQSVRLVFLDTGSLPDFAMQATLRKADDSKVTAVTIADTSEPLGTTITFYRKKGAAWEAEGKMVSLGEAAMFAAVFSDSYANYACALGLALEQFTYLNEVIARRSALIGEFYASADCAVYHGHGRFDDLASAFGIVPDAPPDPAGIIAEGMKSAIASLESANEQAVMNSCARLY